MAGLTMLAIHGGMDARTEALRVLEAIRIARVQAGTKSP